MEPQDEQRDGEKQNPANKRPDNQGEMPRMPLRGMLIWLLVFTIIIIGFQLYLKEQEPVDKIAFNPDFVVLVEKGQVTECQVIEEISGRQYIIGSRKDIDPQTKKPRKFRV